MSDKGVVVNKGLCQLLSCCLQATPGDATGMSDKGRWLMKASVSCSAVACRLHQGIPFHNDVTDKGVVAGASSYQLLSCCLQGQTRGAPGGVT